MALISASKHYQWRPRVFAPFTPRGFPDSHSLNLLRLFCSPSSPDPPATADATENGQIQDPTPEIHVSSESLIESPEQQQGQPQQQQQLPANRRSPRGRCRPQNPDKLENVICRMMANRAWTARLQQSIRKLVPRFDHSLVWKVLHAAQDSEHALQFFRWVERSGFRHDSASHLKIIQILTQVSKLNHARCILLDMPKKGVQWDEEMFVHLIDGYGKAGIVQESVKFFKKMKELGVERTLRSYDTLFMVILRRGRFMMAKRYFNAMLREGIEPTRRTYNVMIWGCFLSLKVTSANRFFVEMKERGISPDVVTYNTMINGYTRVKKLDEVEKFFEEMKGRNIAPTVISYTTVIKGYISVGRVDDGLRLLEEMKSFGIRPNDVTYSTLLPGLCDAGKMPEAKNILGEMVQKHVTPKDNSIFTRLLSCQCSSGDLDAALEVLKSMSRLRIPTQPGHYGILLENFCKAGAYDRAVKLLGKLIKKDIISRPQNSLELESSTYIPMIEYLCDHGRTGKAETFFRQLMKKGIKDSAAFNNLIRGHSKEGNPDGAFEIIRIMDRRGIPRDADAYESLINSYLKKGEPADAKTAMDSMIESGHLPAPSLFRSVVENLFEDGRVQTASRAMKTMVEKGVNDNMDLVPKVLEALLIRGHVEEALERIELLMTSGFVPDFDSLLCVLCEKEKTIAALKLLDFGLARDCPIESSSYDQVLDALLTAGKTLNAYSISCKIMEKGGFTDQSRCKVLIKSLNEEGNTRQADILTRLFRGDTGFKNKKGKKQAPVEA